MKSDLENIKRKIPVTRKATTNGLGARAAIQLSSNTPLPSPGPQEMSISLSDPVYLNLQRQLDALAQDQHNLVAHVNNLARDYQNITSKMNSFQRNFSTQDMLIQQLIQYLYEAERRRRVADGSATDGDNNYNPSPEVQRLVAAYQDASRVNFEQIDDITRRSSLLTGRLMNPSMRPQSPAGSPFSGSPHSSGQSPRSGPFGSISTENYAQQQQGTSDAQRRFSSIASNEQSNQSSDHKSEQQMQQSDFAPAGHRDPSFSSQPQPFTSDTQPPYASMSNQRPQNQARPSLESVKPMPAPGWAVAPKVLLVEDDAVCRKLSSKFLQVFGCQIDLAEDGVSAVNKMNREKYDLVFMDIMMPHLDGQFSILFSPSRLLRRKMLTGVSATSLIRQFDPTTPIISMTSNSNPQEILTYFSHGMNDILPKPFTKEGLLGMLDVSLHVTLFIHI